jgi:hypothetical protein
MRPALIIWLWQGEAIMPVMRVESIVYGVDDVAAATTYFDEWGLKRREKGATGADFALPTGQSLQVRGTGDSALPEAIQGGPTVREVIWGVDTQGELDKIGAELSKDREVARDGAGGLHTQDDIGIKIGFRVAAPGVDPLQPKRRAVNEVVEPGKPPELIRMGHVVFFCPKGQTQKASDFYMKRLNFRLSDRALDLGDFLRAPGSPWHHNLFFLSVTPKAGWNHVAFDVADMNDVVSGGHNMLKKGYKAYSSPGRHIMGSNVFWYFNAVCGGQTEYSADMDMLDDNWKTRVYEHNPGGDQWQFQSSDIIVPQYAQRA